MSLPEEERVRYRATHGRQRPRLPNAAVGLIISVLALFGLYLAYTKHIPFTGHGYELEATFANAVRVSEGSPVRIAGVNVGEVLEIERDGDATKVRFTVGDEGRPVSADATAKLRPRIFFEGNYFIDLDPGSPSARELEHGDSIPISRTATAVQFDEILAALREPVRRDLGRLLAGYGTALTHEPTAADTVGFERSIRDKSAAEALNLAFEDGPRAGRSSAYVAESLLGTERGDLSRLIAGSALTFEGLGRSEEKLRELVSNWNAFTSALADESDNLAATFAELAPTLEVQERSLANLSRSLPAVRAWAREFEPAVAELPQFIADGRPWLEQARPLLSRREAGGLVAKLRRATPGLAGAAQNGLNTLTQIDDLSRCTSDVLMPTGNQVIADRFSTGGPNYREFFYAAANIAGESQTFDGNGLALRLQPSVGDELVSAINPLADPNARRDDRVLYAHVTEAPLGSQPQLGPKPPYRPEVECHTNAVPDLNSGLGQVGPPSPAPATPPTP